MYQHILCCCNGYNFNTLKFGRMLLILNISVVFQTTLNASIREKYHHGGQEKKEASYIKPAYKWSHVCSSFYREKRSSTTKVLCFKKKQTNTQVHRNIGTRFKQLINIKSFTKSICKYFYESFFNKYQFSHESYNIPQQRPFE